MTKREIREELVRLMEHHAQCPDLGWPPAWSAFFTKLNADVKAEKAATLKPDDTLAN